MDKNQILKKDIYSIILFIFLSIICCIIFKLSLAYGFFTSIIFSSYFYIKNGFTIVEILSMIKNALIECKSLFILITLIGATISIWMISGVVPTMLYYGFEYMQNVNFLFASFIITSIISIFMGTAFGTISTIGIALLALGKVFGIPSYIILGAIVSGAFIGDRISPISSIFNLALESIKIQYKDALISILTTLIPGYFACGLFYYFIGKKYSTIIQSSNIDSFIMIISKNFTISPLLLLLPLSIIIMSFLGVTTVKSMSIGLILGIVTAVTIQKVKFTNTIIAMLIGYKASTNSIVLNKILIGGGIVSMIEILLIISGALSLSNILRQTGTIKPIIEKLTSNINSKMDLVLKTGIISSISTFVSDQSIGVIVPCDFLKDKYEELKVKNSILARTISDTGIAIAPLIPWNVNSLFIVAVTGISASAYIPYAVLCYLSPFITIFITFSSRFATKMKS